MFCNAILPKQRNNLLTRVQLIANRKEKEAENAAMRLPSQNIFQDFEF